MSTNIEWATDTWNPVTGCTPISPGCANCYAKRMSTRLAGRCGYPAENPFAVTCHPDRLEQPQHWKKSRRIFVCSMADIFHQEVPDYYRLQVFDMIRRCTWEGGGIDPDHTFLILTKRAEEMWKFMQALRWDGNDLEMGSTKYRNYSSQAKSVWLGVTVEDQEHTWRLNYLEETPAAHRFVSVEPMLSPVDLTPWLAKLDWVICGGETGPGHRPMAGLWAMDLLAQCREYNVPFFFKQMSGKITPIPQSLQVREFPAGMLGHTASAAISPISPIGPIKPAAIQGATP